MTSSSDGDMLQQGQVIRDKWKVANKIGGGGFGEIYEAYDVNTNDLVAIKVESSKAAKQVLKMEVAVLRRLQGKKHACVFYGCGRNERFNYLVMSCQGKNLADLRRESPKQCFSVSTSVRLALQILQGISEIHGIGFLHRDIKPSNFAVGRLPTTCKTVYMLDFGLARQYLNAKGEIRTARAAAGFRGTVRYASITAHKNKEMGRHDDLWSLLYMVVEFLHGSLPWRKIKDKDEVGKMKQEITASKLLDGLPEELLDFAAHLETLKYPDLPNYQLLGDCLRRCLTRLSIKLEDPFDWEVGYENLTKTRITATVTNKPVAKSSTQALREIGLTEAKDATQVNGADDAKVFDGDVVDLNNSARTKPLFGRTSLRGDAAKPKYKRPDFLRPKLAAVDLDAMESVNARLAAHNKDVNGLANPDAAKLKIVQGQESITDNETEDRHNTQLRRKQDLKVAEIDDHTFEARLSDKTLKSKTISRRKRPPSTTKTTDVTQTNAVADDDGISSHQKLAGMTIASKWQGSFDESLTDDDLQLGDIRDPDRASHHGTGFTDNSRISEKHNDKMGLTSAFRLKGTSRPTAAATTAQNTNNTTNVAAAVSQSSYAKKSTDVAVRTTIANSNTSSHAVLTKSRSIDSVNMVDAKNTCYGTKNRVLAAQRAALSPITSPTSPTNRITNRTVRTACEREPNPSYASHSGATAELQAKPGAVVATTSSEIAACDQISNIGAASSAAGVAASKPFIKETNAVTASTPTKSSSKVNTTTAKTNNDHSSVTTTVPSSTKADSGFFSHLRSIRASFHELLPASSSSGKAYHTSALNAEDRSSEGNTSKWSPRTFDNRKSTSGSPDKTDLSSPENRLQMQQQQKRFDEEQQQRLKRTESSDRNKFSKVNEDDKELRRLRRYRRRSDCDSFRDLVQKMHVEIESTCESRTGPSQPAVVNSVISAKSSLAKSSSVNVIDSAAKALSNNALPSQSHTTSKTMAASPAVATSVASSLTYNNNNNNSSQVSAAATPATTDDENNKLNSLKMDSLIKPIPPQYSPKGRLLPSRLRRYQLLSFQSMDSRNS